MTMYATDFSEIPATLAANQELRQTVLDLIAVQPMAGKVTEGGDRVDRLRAILKELVSGRVTLPQAYQRAENDLPWHTSIHSDSNRVFAFGWAERQIRTQYSRFYIQAVMERLLADGQTHCLVPHSSGKTPIPNAPNCWLEAFTRYGPCTIVWSHLTRRAIEERNSKSPSIPIARTSSPRPLKRGTHKYNQPDLKNRDQVGHQSVFRLQNRRQC